MSILSAVNVIYILFHLKFFIDSVARYICLSAWYCILVYSW